MEREETEKQMKKKDKKEKRKKNPKNVCLPRGIRNETSRLGTLKCVWYNVTAIRIRREEKRCCEHARRGRGIVMDPIVLVHQDAP
jgi:hypothetical protein